MIHRFLLGMIYNHHAPIIHCIVKAIPVVTLVCNGLGSCHYVYTVVYLISCSR
jgi:hypothetical protein